MEKSVKVSLAWHRPPVPATQTWYAPVSDVVDPTKPEWRWSIVLYAFNNDSSECLAGFLSNIAPSGFLTPGFRFTASDNGSQPSVTVTVLEQDCAKAF